MHVIVRNMQPNQKTPPAAGRSVLCIEDEHFIGELYERALTKSGYKVAVVTDGAEGLKAAETNQYDIILLDLMLPNVTGIEILRQLRDPARVPPLKSKIIITTNLEQREDVRADIEKQADGYLVKAELTPHELVEFINTIK
jgi:DNA-binding response OmpR family regulator